MDFSYLGFIISTLIPLFLRTLCMLFRKDFSLNRGYLCVSIYGNMHMCVVLSESRRGHKSPWISDDMIGNSEPP